MLLSVILFAFAMPDKLFCSNTSLSVCSFCKRFLVPLTGLEPVRYRYRGILSPLCLPIPPQRREQYNYNRLLSRCQYILFCVDVSHFFDLKTIPFHTSGATRRTHSASCGAFLLSPGGFTMHPTAYAVCRTTVNRA